MALPTFLKYYGDGSKEDNTSRVKFLHKAAQCAVNDLKKVGRFYHTTGGELFYITKDTAKVIPLVKDDIRLRSLISNAFHVNAASKEVYDHLVQAFQLEAFQNGEQITIHKFCHADRNTRTVYLSMLDGRRMLKLTGEEGQGGLLTVPNGTDGIFFLDDPKWQPWELQVEYDDNDPDVIFYNRHAVRDYLVAPANFIDNAYLTAEEQRWVYEQWLTTLPLDLEERPLLLLCGEPGGGKSAVLRWVTKALFGPSGDVSIIRKEDAFNAAVSKSPFLVLDNLDNMRADWLPVSLETAATGGKITLRELYSTNSLVEAQARSWIGITSTDSRYMDSRRALADRTLSLKIGRLDEFSEKEKSVDLVLRHRDEILTDLAVRLLRYVSVWRQFPNTTTTFRLASWGIALLRVARGNKEEQLAVQFLKKLQGEQEALQEKNESLFTALDEYFALHPDRDTYSGTAGQIADIVHNLDGGFKVSAKTMGVRLNNLKKLLERKYQMTKTGGKKTAAIYTFHRPVEAPAPAPAPEPAPPTQEAAETKEALVTA